MRLWKLFVPALLVPLVIAACSDASTEGNAIVEAPTNDNNEHLNAMSEPVSLDAAAAPDGSKHIIVAGETNLPNGSKLSITITDSKQEWRGHGETIVNGHKFSSPRIEIAYGLKPDEYTIEVLLLASMVQPETVRRVIGYEGEYLTGQLVSGEGILRAASYSFVYKAGGDQEINDAMAASAKANAMNKSRINELIQIGRSMQTYRNNMLQYEDACLSKMRKYLPQAKEINSSLPISANTDLRAAVVNTLQCLTCTSNAMEHCINASYWLEKVN